MLAAESFLRNVAPSLPRCLQRNRLKGAPLRTAVLRVSIGLGAFQAAATLTPQSPLVARVG